MVSDSPSATFRVSSFHAPCTEDVYLMHHKATPAVGSPSPSCTASRSLLAHAVKQLAFTTHLPVRYSQKSIPERIGFKLGIERASHFVQKPSTCCERRNSAPQTSPMPLHSAQNSTAPSSTFTNASTCRKICFPALFTPLALLTWLKICFAAPLASRDNQFFLPKWFALRKEEESRSVRGVQQG